MHINFQREVEQRWEVEAALLPSEAGPRLQQSRHQLVGLGARLPQQSLLGQQGGVRQEEEALQQQTEHQVF